MRTTVKTTKAPAPIGPFSQATIAGNLVFVSAQFSLDPSTGKFVMENIESETTQVMENIKAILAEAGVGFSHVVKSSIFLKDMQDYAKVNGIYGSYFTEPFPARETIQVGALPKNVNIEISVIAVKN
ncbi:MAG TPA: RidA family protein [Puia sp.]|nr:RidA family protein [Puia sp.]